MILIYCVCISLVLVHPTCPYNNEAQEFSQILVIKTRIPRVPKWILLLVTLWFFSMT